MKYIILKLKQLPLLVYFPTLFLLGIIFIAQPVTLSGKGSAIILTLILIILGLIYKHKILLIAAIFPVLVTYLARTIFLNYSFFSETRTAEGLLFLYSLICYFYLKFKPNEKN